MLEHIFGVQRKSKNYVKQNFFINYINLIYIISELKIEKII
jgi:hypothetical protein